MSFFLTAYILEAVGQKQFGVYVLLETVVACLALLDLAGVEGAFVKFIAEYHAKKDYDRVRQVINLGFSYYLVFQLALSAAILAFEKPLLRIFRFEEAVTAEIHILMVGFLVISIIRGSFRVFRSTLLGLQRMDITTLIDLITTVPNIAGTVVFLALGWGLKGLVINGVLVALLTVGIQIGFVYKLLPGLRFKPFSFEREIVRKAVGYGVKIQVARFAEIINAQVDKILLGVLLLVDSQIMVGFYELGAKPARVIRDLPSQLLPAITPAASQLDALEDALSLQKLYYRGSKYLAMVTLPLIFFTVTNASALVRLWLGEGYGLVAYALQVLSLGYLAYLLVGMGRLVARGMGVPQFEMRAALLITGLNVLLSAGLIMVAGFKGALYGTALSSIVGSLYFMSLFHRYLGRPFWKMIGVTVYPVPLAACLSGVGISLLATRGLAILGGPPAGRLDAFVSLLLGASVFFGVYVLVLLILGYFDEYDRDVISRGWLTIKKAKPERVG